MMSKNTPEQAWASQIKNEVTTGNTNWEARWGEYEAFLDLFDAERSEKDYDWMSNIFIPEFPAHMLTQASTDVDQYFQTRDFVETYIQDESDEAQLAAASAEECINRTLNQKKLYHYQKFVRSKMINHLNGFVYFKAEWKKKFKKAVTGYEPTVKSVSTVEGGDALAIEYGEDQPIIEDVIVEDRFDYDILDPRQVIVSEEYTYSLQDKKWITINFEKTLNQLKVDKDDMGYFNLDELEQGGAPAKTNVATNTYDEHNDTMPETLDPNKSIDIYERHGAAWVVVTEKDDQTDEPLKVSIGVDERGEPKEKAEWMKVISTIAVHNATSTLIRFQLSPYKDHNGERYFPIGRGLCYIHPATDHGVGDGKYARELQIAINDSFNLGNDRSRLATMPVMKGKKYSLEDNSTVFFEPANVIHLEDPDDLVEMKIDDNINGQLSQISFLSGKMQQTDSIFPSTMGQLPAPSTTATAIAGTEQRANSRENYKGMSYEYTFLTDLYWMILQMTNQFAEPETGDKLMGEKVFFFDPSLDYFYKPVSQSIESESSKAAKIQQLTTVLQNVAQLGDPRAVNLVLKKIFTLMGDEVENFANQLFPEDQPLPNVATPEAGGEVPVSNERGIPQSATEQFARG